MDSAEVAWRVLLQQQNSSAHLLLHQHLQGVGDNDLYRQS
jgi:hypothetical protein